MSWSCWKGNKSDALNTALKAKSSLSWYHVYGQLKMFRERYETEDIICQTSFATLLLDSDSVMAKDRSKALSYTFSDSISNTDVLTVGMYIIIGCKLIMSRFAGFEVDEAGFESTLSFEWFSDDCKHSEGFSSCGVC